MSDNGGWTGWSCSSDGQAVTVTSDRLQSSEVANVWFPKVRSWFALGAPLELLSPLSIIRILALVALVAWPTGIALGHPVSVAIALTVVSIGICVYLNRIRSISQRHSSVLLVIYTSMVIAAVSTTDGIHRVLVVSPVIAVMSVFAGLFVALRPLLVAVSSGATTFLVVTRITHDGMSFADAVVLTLFSGLLALMTALTARTSRLAGSLDPETGVSNMQGLTNALRALPDGTDVVVATVHLSGVTEVRDALGHGISTELIRRAVEDFGQILPSSARVGRSGDDEIIVLAPNDPSGSVPMDTHISTTVRQLEAAIGSGHYLAGKIEVSLNAHTGVSIAHTSADGSANDVLRQSAIAARSARDSGRSVAFWDGTTTTLSAEDLEVLADLRTAIDRNELWLAYQPQVRAGDAAIESVEALLRWTSPRHGNVPPGRFIPLAERTGLIGRLTDWVLAEALDAQVRWRADDVDVSVSVNISPLSLRSVDFAEQVAAQVDRRDLPPSALMLEVTESMAFDIPEAVERLAPLHARGVRISIDDFGTGYTSLSVLPRLPLDELKVDQQFVREARTSKASEAIVVSVCQLAHRLGLTAVAEGVEDSDDADLMASFGFDLLQGYHFARPMPEAALLAHVASSRSGRRSAAVHV